jgi:drug/metabolite transporter (DMT)-like permease
MVPTGNCFALANAVTWTVTLKMGFKAHSDACWQYGIATAFSAPFTWHCGWAVIKTRHPFLHLARIGLSVLGVQAFTQAFAIGMAPRHVIALVMKWPTVDILCLLILGGAIMYFAQHFLTLTSAAANAAFVQPFDDLKLFSNILVSWLVLSFAPDMTYWTGILMVFAGSVYGGALVEPAAG